MKSWLALLLCVLLMSCDRSLFLYAHKWHDMQQTDSVVIAGKVKQRMFMCMDSCGKRDTFPNPEVSRKIGRMIY